MKVYFACYGKREPHHIVDGGFKNILMSYHYEKDNTETLKYIQESEVELFIDSGAFSALNSKAVIIIDDYCRFLINNSIKIYASLDVIGNAEKTWNNWIYMREKYNLNPIPTFHMNEPFEWLEKYLNLCDYIAFGGMVNGDNVDSWLTHVWKIALNKNPNIKIHGFGMTIADLIYKYPWYSFDSTSFKSGKRFGRVPQFNGKKLFMISAKKFKFNLQSEHPEILTNDALFNRLSDIAGAQAYFDMVKYLSQFDKRNLFMNQTTLF